MLGNSLRKRGEGGESNEGVSGVWSGGSGVGFCLSDGRFEVSLGLFEVGEEEAGRFVKAGVFSPYRVRLLEGPLCRLSCDGGEVVGYFCSPDCWREVGEGLVRSGGEVRELANDRWAGWLR